MTNWLVNDELWVTNSFRDCENVSCHILASVNIARPCKLCWEILPILMFQYWKEVEMWVFNSFRKMDRKDWSLLSRRNFLLNIIILTLNYFVRSYLMNNKYLFLKVHLSCSWLFSRYKQSFWLKGILNWGDCKYLR